MEIQQLKAFLAVAKTGNFSRAAQLVLRTQPSVTVAVRRLERELNVRLFERHGRKTILTAAGASLSDAVGPLLTGWDRLKDVVAPTTAGRLSGHVRIGAGEPVMLYLLPKALKAFRKENPDVRVSLYCQRRDQTLEMLKAGELDFGVRSMERAPAWAAYRPSLSYERVVLAQRGHAIGKSKRLTLAELARYPLLAGDMVSTTRRIVEGKLTEAGLHWEVGLEAGGWEVLKRYAREGLGVAVVPAICLTEEDKRTLTVARAGHLFGYDRYGVVTRRESSPSEAARRFITRIDPGYST
jgi:DNA-binding transcriptional LysR family regulator